MSIAYGHQGEALNYATGKSGTIGKNLSSNVLNFDFRSDVKSEIKRISDSVPKNIIHLAGVVGEGKVADDIDSSYNINVTKTLELALECRDAEFKNFIYISTSHVYAKSGSMLTEESEISPRTEYGRQKAEAEERLTEIFRHSTTKFAIVRVFSVLDTNTAPFTLGGALKRIVDGDESVRISNSSDVRDFMTPKGIACAIERLASIEIEGTYNLCTAVPLTVQEVGMRILTMNNVADPARFFKKETSEVPYLVGENKKIRNLVPSLKLSWDYV